MDFDAIVSPINNTRCNPCIRHFTLVVLAEVATISLYEISPEAEDR